jgi:hypothetical protein
MKIDEKIIKRFEELISNSKQVISTNYQHQGVVDFQGSSVDREKSHQWGMSCLSILKNTFGQESDFYKRFNDLYSSFDYLWAVTTGLGILKAAKDDYENGYLFNTRTLIEAEIFDEFIEQAEELLAKNYFLASAVIAGCVLEDCLRKLCDRNSITLPAKATIEPMNVELAKAGIYNKLWQKKITALADLRNKAAHNLGGFTKDDVEDMIRDVRRFMEDYFS